MPNARNLGCSPGSSRGAPIRGEERAEERGEGGRDWLRHTHRSQETYHIRKIPPWRQKGKEKKNPQLALSLSLSPSLCIRDGKAHHHQHRLGPSVVCHRVVGRGGQRTSHPSKACSQADASL